MTAREQAAAAQREAEGRKRMSCNGCRVLRKGCSDTCILRPCLQWIDSAEAQGHATVFVAKFFGRAGLMAFINAVPENQRPALFQSLLYEACGRTVNPVYGAVGLLASGNWAVCQAAVETVLKGGTLRPPHASPSATCSSRPSANLSSSIGKFAMKPDLEIPLLQQQQPRLSFTAMPSKVKEEPQDTSSNHARHGAAAIVSEQTRRVRQRCEDAKNPNAVQVCYEDNVEAGSAAANLDLTLNCEASSSSRLKRRVSSPSLVSVNSEGSVTSLESGSFGRTHSSERRIMLDLFP